MNFSVRQALRKWPFGPTGCDQRPILAVAALALMFCAAPAQAASLAGGVPLPRPRAAEAPQQPAEAETSAEPDNSVPDKPLPDKPAAAARPAEPALSACRQALDDSVAIAPSIPAIRGPGACGGEDLVRLEAIVLPDKGRVQLRPAATMRCTMASAVADWIRTDIVPLASGLNTTISELDNFDSFDCRGRNRVVGAKLSEHGRANALDVRAIKLASGQSIALTDRDTPRELREKVLGSVCARFSTVLGPGSDGYHEDHIHLDLAERRGNYKICHWNIWDALPKIAPLMPAERPPEAPPREVADGTANEQPADAARPADTNHAEPAAAPSAAAEPEQEAAEPEHPPAAKPAAKSKPHKRRAPPPPFNLLR